MLTDANDNPPKFTEDNYTVFMQEDKDFGYILARFSITDADDSPNAGPFTFDIRDGNEDNSFRVVQDGTLRTAAKFNHKIKDKYQLQIRAFDNGSPPLFSDVIGTVSNKMPIINNIFFCHTHFKYEHNHLKHGIQNRT